MQPDNQLGSQPNQNPYEFITNHGQTPKQSFLGGGSSFTKRLLVIAGGAILLMILAAIVLSLLSSGGQSATQSMKEIVLEQQEIILVATDGASEATDPTVRALATTSNLSVQSDKTNLSAYLEKAGSPVNKKLIPLTMSTESTTQLENARSSNRYDEVFEELLRNKLAQYQLNIQSAYDQASSTEAKTVLETAYISASTLLSPPEANE